MFGNILLISTSSYLQLSSILLKYNKFILLRILYVSFRLLFRIIIFRVISRDFRRNIVSDFMVKTFFFMLSNFLRNIELVDKIRLDCNYCNFGKIHW